MWCLRIVPPLSQGWLPFLSEQQSFDQIFTRCWCRALSSKWLLFAVRQVFNGACNARIHDQLFVTWYQTCIATCRTFCLCSTCQQFKEKVVTAQCASSNTPQLSWNHTKMSHIDRVHVRLKMTRFGLWWNHSLKMNEWKPTAPRPGKQENPSFRCSRLATMSPCHPTNHQSTAAISATSKTAKI